MIIRFEMSGGYGGLFVTNPLSVTIDTDDLPEEEAAELLEMIERFAEAEVPAMSEPGTPVRDAMQYRVLITNGGATAEYELDDSTVPSEAGPLLDLLRTAAVNERMNPD